MSQPIWTPDALRSEFSSYHGKAWRLVEAQHLVSTRKIVDSLDEQTLLEAILEDAKPPVPPRCRHLDYLLATPFRYQAYPRGSRFRRAGLTLGVWYGAERPETAAAEMGFYRLLFFAESPATPFPANAGEYSAICARLATGSALDLTAGALAADQALWTHLTDYGPCQALADAARTAAGALLRYRSVRDPDQGSNIAVLDCAAFADPAPTIERQTWRIYLSPSAVLVQREFPRRDIEISIAAFAVDPRIAAIWPDQML